MFCKADDSCTSGFPIHKHIWRNLGTALCMYVGFPLHMHNCTCANARGRKVLDGGLHGGLPGGLQCLGAMQVRGEFSKWHMKAL